MCEVFRNVGAGPVVHRLAPHPCSERRQERWISRTSRSSSAPGVGKSEHWATALSREGRKVFDRALPNDEARLREVYQRLQAKGQVLVVVDQPATIGALAVAVAQDMGITVGYLPGLSMRRIADLTPGSAKTDAKDAAVIAGAARSMPHTLRAVSASDENAAALSMLTGFDLDLARQVNQSANRIRGLFTQIHPALEAVLGPWLEHDAILEVITAWPTPADLKRAGKARIDAKLKAHGCRRHTTWAGQIVSALELLNRPGFDGGSDDTEGSLSWDRRSTPMSCASEPRGRALEALADPARAKGAIRRIAEELGVHPEALRTWVKKAQVDGGLRPGTTTDEAQRIKELEKEVRELRRANAILKSASAFFAAELDRPSR